MGFSIRGEIRKKERELQVLAYQARIRGTQSQNLAAKQYLEEEGVQEKLWRKKEIIDSQQFVLNEPSITVKDQRSYFQIKWW